MVHHPRKVKFAASIAKDEQQIAPLICLSGFNNRRLPMLRSTPLPQAEPSACSKSGESKRLFEKFLLCLMTSADIILEKIDSVVDPILTYST